MASLFHLHGPLQACLTEIFCHDLGFSEVISFFMLNPKISVKIESFIESIMKIIEKKNQTTSSPVGFEP